MGGIINIAAIQTHKTQIRTLFNICTEITITNDLHLFVIIVFQNQTLKHKKFKFE